MAQDYIKLGSQQPRALGGVSTPDVLAVRHNFQMVWSHARSLFTQMVEHHAKRDRSDELDMGSAVSELSFTVNPDHAVAGSQRRVDADPARSAVATILFSPMLRSEKNSRVSKTSDMSSDESHVFTGHMADAFIRHPCDRCSSATTTLAYAIRIRGRQLSSAPLLTVVKKVVVVLALDMAVACVRLLDLVRGLTTTARTQLHPLNANEGIG